MRESTRVPERTVPDTWTLMAKTKRGSFCFGGDFPVATVEVTGVTSAPELFTNYERLITKDGMWKGTQYLGGRSITLSMNILANGATHINNVINELNWAFPIGYGEDQEEIELHFTIPGVANGGAAWIKGMVRKRDIKLDQQYAVNGAPRIDIEIYCHNPEFHGYGRATDRMDTAAGFSAGGAPCKFVFTETGLFFPKNFDPGEEVMTLVTNNAKDRDAKGCPIGPDWEAEIHGPISKPKLNRRNYFGDLWSIELDEDRNLLAGQTLVYRPTAPTLPDKCQPDTKLSYTGRIDLAVNGVTVESGLKYKTTRQVKGGKPELDTKGGAWGHVGTLRKASEIATSEYWSILPGISDAPIDGNAYGFVTWWGGEFI